MPDACSDPDETTIYVLYYMCTAGDSVFTNSHNLVLVIYAYC